MYVDVTKWAHFHECNISSLMRESMTDSPILTDLSPSHFEFFETYFTRVLVDWFRLTISTFRNPCKFYGESFRSFADLSLVT